MEATKLAESLPHIQKSAKQSTRKFACQECEQETERWFFERFNGDMIRVCPVCVLKVRGREAKRRGEELAATVIPKLYQQARIKHLPNGLQQKIDALPNDKGLFLWGPQGVGKSYALCAVMRKLLMEGKTAKRISYEVLCLQLRDTYRPGSTKTELGVIKPLIEVDVLFLEDIGVTVAGEKLESDFSLRTFLVLLDQRLENCRPTFITTNKSVEQLAKSFDPRVASRLQQACEIIQITGRDRRTAQKPEQNRN